MGIDTQVTTFLDMYRDLQNKTREQTGVTATENLAKRAINTGLHDMHVGTSYKLPWAERRAVLRTQAKYDTGTVTVSKGSTAVTGSGTAWDTNNDFGVKNARTTGRITINGTTDIYDVSAVGSDTSITLADAYVGADVSAGAYFYFEDMYDLASDFLRPVDIQMFDTNREIRLIGRNDFRRYFPRNKTFGQPRFATIMEHAFSGSTARVRRVHLSPVPDEAYLAPYDYITANLAVSSAGTAQIQLSADTDEPIVPLQYRHAIVYHGLYNWYRDRKDDNRANAAKAEYTDLMLRTVADHEVGGNRPHIHPVMSTYRRKAQTPYRSGRSRRHTTGTAFDQLRDR